MRMFMMEMNLCSMCLSPVSRNYVSLDALWDILKNLHIDLGTDFGSEGVICKDCESATMEFYKFHTTCTYTENVLVSQKTESNLPLDLKNVPAAVLRMGGTNPKSDDKVCRLCLKPTKLEDSTPLDYGQIKSFFDKHLPQVDMSLTKFPLSCNNCIQQLGKVINYLDNISKKKEATSEFRIIKAELEIKEECPDSDEIENQQQTNVIDNNKDKHAPHNSTKKKRTYPHKQETHIKWYHCDICEYKTKRNSVLKNHMQIHSENSIFKCTKCGITCSTKYSLSRHDLVIHNNDSKKEFMYCDVCPYRSTVKQYFNKHIQRHLSQGKLDEKKTEITVEFYHCAHCTYKTAMKTDLGRHFLVHKRETEVAMFKCMVCQFQSKYKRSLIKHVRRKHS